MNNRAKMDSGKDMKNFAEQSQKWLSTWLSNFYAAFIWLRLLFRFALASVTHYTETLWRNFFLPRNNPPEFGKLDDRDILKIEETNSFYPGVGARRRAHFVTAIISRR
jgi:hypothetical protein